MGWIFRPEKGLQMQIHKVNHYCAQVPAQGLFLKFHPLSAALCDPTDSQQKCDVKQTAVIDCRLKPVQRELNVSPPRQGHGLCTKCMRLGSHC